MDPRVFDRLARALAIAPTRRTTIAGLSGAFAALVSRLTPATTPETDAQSRICRPLGKSCFPDRGLGCCRGATCQTGVCRCPERARVCGDRCLPKRKCCHHADCPGNQRCQTGRCQCPAGKKRCGKRCIARDTCCRDGECGAHGACARGSCDCARGAKRCGKKCIPVDNCCQDTDCDPDQNCEDHVCVAKPCGAGGPCRVFLTNIPTNGNLGGVAGADARCQAAAFDSSLTRGGTFRAWIADATVESAPAERFTNLDTTGPYVLVDTLGTLVANNWEDLTTPKGDDDHYLRTAINVTENGESRAGYVWTNTTPSGARYTDVTEAICENWTVSGGIHGRRGNSGQTTAAWTVDSVISCSVSYSLYCFEQG